MFEDIEIPWPDEGDSFLTPSDDWASDAVIESSSGDWYAYIIGYKEAGDMVVETMLRKRVY
jgi:hypothetical protein